MLLSLHVKNLALIEEEEVTFTDGLNILTGETGAGKSIIIGSINMALGARADRNVIRTGTDYALIELTFSADNERQLEKLRELGLSPETAGDAESSLPEKENILPEKENPCLKTFGIISSSSSARSCPLEASAPSAARPLHSNNSGKWESC